MFILFALIAIYISRSLKKYDHKYTLQISSLQRTVNEYDLPVIKLLTVNNNYLPLIKIFTVNKIIYR